MILLDSPKGDREGGYESHYSADENASPLADVNPAEEVFNPEAASAEEKPKKTKKEDKVEDDEIPF